MIGVDLLVRSPRGVALTAEGKLFLECREVLRRVDEAVSRTRALARGEYGVLHVGYAPSPTLELLPPALADFQKAVPDVRVILHDMAPNELCARLTRWNARFGRHGPACRVLRGHFRV